MTRDTLRVMARNRRKEKTKMVNEDWFINANDVYDYLMKSALKDSQPRAIRRAAKIVIEFPAADVEPKRKTGRWVGMQEYCQHLFDTTGERYIMSQLGISHPHCNQCWAENESRKPFCPNCGAKMLPEPPKGEEDGKK